MRMPGSDDGSPDRDGPGSSVQTLMIEERRIAELLPHLPQRRPYDLNAIVGTAAQISAGGFPHPVIMGRQGPLQDGALLIDAARWLDLETVPCLVTAGLSGAQERHLRQILSGQELPPRWTLDELVTAIQARLTAEEQAALEGFEPIDLDAILREQCGPDDSEVD